MLGKIDPVEREAKVLRSVREVPGINLMEIVERTGMRVWQVYNALERLESDRRVKSIHVNHERRVFSDKDSPTFQHHVAVLRWGRSLPVAKLILERAALSQGEITEETGIPRRRFRELISLLEDAGLVKILKDGRHRRYIPTPALKPALRFVEKHPVK